MDTRDERREEDLAGAEAAEIGGRKPDYAGADDEAQRPLAEAGEGESEGFEQAEADLVDEASHAENRHEPKRDAFTGEVESDEAGAVYGDADQVGDPDDAA